MRSRDYRGLYVSDMSSRIEGLMPHNYSCCVVVNFVAAVVQVCT